MSLDVDDARRLLQATLATAREAAREHTAAQSAAAVEELAAWERIGEALVPELSAAALSSIAAVVDEPRLPELLAARDARRAALQADRDACVDAVLDPTELEELHARRKAIELRLGAERARLKDLRARPGVLAWIDAARSGGRLKDDQATVVRQHDERQRAIAALEAEGTRLAAVAARHHRAKKQIDAVDEALRLLDDEVLRDARRLVVDKLQQGQRRPPAVAALLHRVDGIAAKRKVLALLFESHVRPHGAALTDLEREGVSVSGYETVSFPQRVDLCCRTAASAIDTFRRVCAAAAAFDGWDSVVDNWWAAFAPGIPPPPGAPVGSGVAPAPARRDAADVASDKLAAGWSAFAASAAAATETLERPSPSAPLLAADFDDPTSAEPWPLLGPGNPLAPQQTFVDWPIRAAVDAPAPPDPFHAPLPAPRSAALAFQDVARPTFSPGTRVGRCLVESLIGKGGMGEVYKARLEGDAGFSRAVVLKRLAVDHGEDPELLRAFAREAGIAARIAHPNVVQIFDVQSNGREPYMIMELLDGLSLLKLATRARRAGIDLDIAVLTRCALDAARGLHAAHSMRNDDGTLVGLVHRDVSPDNLFLCSNGFTKLLDFGIARRGDWTTMTRGNELKGKIPYMSPEQILGEPLDARSDLFSLGSSFYWLLTGERPFVGDNEVSTLYAVVNKPHKPIIADHALGDVVEMLLRKRREDRPANALEVVELLERAAPATPEQAAAFLARVEE